MQGGDRQTPAQFFEGSPEGFGLFQVVERLVGEFGEADVRVSRSQVAFRRRKGFAYLWRPGIYVNSDVPAVLSLALPHEVGSSRFKSVVHPSPGAWMHHLELRGIDDLDDEVRGWLAEAYANAD